jgi:hypothetical protein
MNQGYGMEVSAMLEGHEEFILGWEVGRVVKARNGNRY